MAERDADLCCAKAVELMTEYLEGALGEPSLERFEQHLELCSGCDHYLDQLRHTISTAGRLAEEHVPPELRADLVRAFRGWKEQSS